MKLLDRYLLKETVPPLLGAALTFIVLLVGHMLYTVVEIVVERGVPLPSVMKFLALKIPAAAVMALPVSALLAVSLVFNRLAADGELVALRAGGASFWRLMLPAALIGLLTAAAVFALNEALAPRCDEASRRLLVEAISRQRTLAFQPKRFLELSNDAAVYANDVDPTRDRLLGVKLFLLRGDQPPVLVMAREAIFTDQGLTVPHAEAIAPDWNGDVTWGSVGTVRVNLSSEALALPGGAGELRQMPLADLWRQWHQLRAEAPRRAARYALELHSRIAMAAAALFFALLAGPLTLAVGRGRTLSGVGLSLVFVFVYYLGMLWTRLLGERGILPPAAAAWAENIAVLALIAWLVRRLR